MEDIIFSAKQVRKRYSAKAGSLCKMWILNFQVDILWKIIGKTGAGKYYILPLYYGGKEALLSGTFIVWDATDIAEDHVVDEPDWDFVSEERLFCAEECKRDANAGPSPYF